MLSYPYTRISDVEDPTTTTGTANYTFFNVDNPKLTTTIGFGFTFRCDV
jgi:hypothetical protein